jgi:hypothetical protein
MQIGDMTVSFAMLELNIQILLFSLLCEHQRIGQIIAAQLPFAKLLPTIMGLYIERHGEDDDFLKLKKLLMEASKIEQERNKITHSFWGVGRTPDEITRSKRSRHVERGLNFQFEDYNEAKFVKFNTHIKKLSIDFLDFYIDLLEKGKIINTKTGKISI